MGLEDKADRIGTKHGIQRTRKTPGNMSRRRYWPDLSESGLRPLRKSNGSAICRDGFELMNSRRHGGVCLAGMT